MCYLHILLFVIPILVKAKYDYLTGRIRGVIMAAVYTDFTSLVQSFQGNPAPALVYEQEGAPKSISYDELYNKIHQCRDYTPGDVQILVTHPAPETIIRILAAVCSGCDLILCDEKVPEEITSSLKDRIQSSHTGMPARQEGRLYFFTSGTSQRSRSVVLTPQSLLLSTAGGQAMLPCSEKDRILCILPLSHVFGFVCGMLWGFYGGAQVAVGRGVRHLMDDCLFYKPTILPCVPTIIQALLRFNMLNPELKTVLVGAAPCPASIVHQLQDKKIQVYLGYGLTETSSGIAISQDQENPSLLYPCPGASLRIEPDGEISVVTRALMEGYFGEPDPTIEEPDPDHPGQTVRRLFTGDLGSLDDQGRLTITGRKKDILVLPDGTKVFCPEYEETLSEALGTSELAIAQKNGRPVLIIESSVEADVVLLAVTQFNRERARGLQIAEVIYTNEALPRTAVGKLRRWQLQQWIDEGTPARRKRDTFYSTNTEHDQMLREQWI